jgi:ATP-dependent 26S proteasome regulatory subunit
MTSATEMHYANSLEHLGAEMELLELSLRREVRRMKPADAGEPDILRGMFISTAEIDRLLGAVSAAPAEEDPGQMLTWLGEAAEIETEIERRTRASLEQGVHLTLPRLAQMFGLTRFEQQVVVICLATELDLRYEKIYAYLQDDVTRKQPGIDLVLRLLCSNAEERLQARACFSPRGTLFRAHILTCPEGDDRSLLARSLKLDEQVTRYLLLTEAAGRGLPAHCRDLTSNDPMRDQQHHEQIRDRLCEIVRRHLTSPERTGQRLIIHFYGPPGGGKQALASAICREAEISLFAFDPREARQRDPRFEEAVARSLREGLLRAAAVYIEHFDQMIGDDRGLNSDPRILARAVDEFGWLTFIATEDAWEPGGLFDDHLFFSIELPIPDAASRTAAWARIAANGNDFAPDVDWRELAFKFRLTPGQMRDASIAARNLALLRAPGSPITLDDLYAGCRLKSNRKLSTLACRLSPRRNWSDITLPAHSLLQLREICDQIKHRRLVLTEWGFEGRHPMGQGLCALFYGPSGTGKTLAVEVLARELKLDAYKVDLSTVVSKYIGETEKNLSKVFQEAETSNAILFFDEADALFGKRTEVKDAHDRFANIEINYLLQRMEEFAGLVILSTNLRKNIDEAFFRRMQVAVEFPFPGEGDRYAIWKQHLPERAPVADDVDFQFLAGRLNVPGGSIRNIVVNAAFLAAANSGVIHMRHFIRAARREYEKIGRLCTEADFTPYHHFLNEIEPAAAAAR